MGFIKVHAMELDGKDHNATIEEVSFDRASQAVIDYCKNNRLIPVSFGWEMYLV